MILNVLVWIVIILVSFMLIWFLICIIFFFFKQKTAYDMRISDWSSDVCSSDLLKPRVHFEEIETLAGGIGARDDQFDRARAVITHRLRQRDRLLAHAFTHRRRHERRRRFLDHLLVAALDRAFALAEIDDVAVLVAEHLDFDMARVFDELFDEHAVIAEARQPLALGDRTSPRRTS